MPQATSQPRYHALRTTNYALLLHELSAVSSATALLVSHLQNHLAENLAFFEQAVGFLGSG